LYIVRFKLIHVDEYKIHDITHDVKMDVG